MSQSEIASSNASSRPVREVASRMNGARVDVLRAKAPWLAESADQADGLADPRQSGRAAPGKPLILGVARTGAKFTPYNHADTGDAVFDTISRGDAILCAQDAIADELRQLYKTGVRYVHEHARNPATREQTCETNAYRRFGRICADACTDAIVSFGASRNGPEIDAAIAAAGEWARVAHVGLPRADGGAHFVTAQAAVELQIVKDMERQGFVAIDDPQGRYTVLRDLRAYQPSEVAEVVDLPVYSTAQGRNYGSSSAAVQLAVLRRSIAERGRLGLPFEVEWVQTARSSLLTWYLANVLGAGPRAIGRLNITILFGFSPRLPFPQTYAQFKSVVDTARAIADRDGGAPLRVSISCGAAVLPQHAARHLRPIDVGPRTGVVAGPMERLVAYACRPDSGVDILRVGLEDAPYVVDPSGAVLPATNVLLAQETVRQIAMNGAGIVTGREELQRFLEHPGTARLDQEIAWPA